ncbi:MAG: cellulase [Acidobacteriia bacterium]|nr:cellulase [Terriglobia bacterium]
MKQVMGLMAVLASSLSAESAGRWPLWESYVSQFMDGQGRIVDRTEKNRTTSEAQAYAMFFALVANDRGNFEKLLNWTQNNLSGGDLASKLPAWNWGVSPEGRWTVLDPNSASDADLWMAYVLLEAGRWWGERRFDEMGSALADRIAAAEVAEIPKLGLMLLPGARYFKIGDDQFVLNPSYLPLQVLLGVSSHQPAGPWKRIAARVPEVLHASAPHGFALDWVRYRASHGFVLEGLPEKKTVASYDAIRVYLWAGMLAQATPGRDRILESLGGMSRYLRKHRVPPAIVGLDGAVEDENGSIGYSAALIPYLEARGESAASAGQCRRLESQLNPLTGLYGKEARYYDQNLALFATAWHAGRYRFNADGSLNLKWR